MIVAVMLAAGAAIWALAELVHYLVLRAKVEALRHDSPIDLETGLATAMHGTARVLVEYRRAGRSGQSLRVCRFDAATPAAAIDLGVRVAEHVEFPDVGVRTSATRIMLVFVDSSVGGRSARTVMDQAVADGVGVMTVDEIVGESVTGEVPPVLQSLLDVSEASS